MRDSVTTQQPGSSIEFRNLTKQYPGAESPSVDSVNLVIEPGSFVVLLGPSGCGKTTLLKMVNRIIEPTSGQILLDDQDSRSFDAPALRRRIGYVIQQTGLFPHMKIGENVAVVPKLLNWDKARINARVDELLELIGLPPAEYRDRYPSQLSGGEQQRVGLARALAVNPSTMLMDEPFGALDAITRNRLQGELLDVHQTLGQTILFVTHDIDEAVRLADQIVVMQAGSIVQTGSPLDIVSNPANDFVSDLVGGGDALRRLSLITAHSVMSDLNGAAHDTTLPVLPADSTLRHALEAMLSSGTSGVTLTDSVGTPTGGLDQETIWQVASGEPVGLNRS